MGFGDLESPLYPQTLAIVHLWVAGWLSLTAVGVLTQFLPVTTAARLWSVRLAWFHLTLHVVGVVGLAITLFTGVTTTWAPIAGVVLWSGLFLTALNLGVTVWKSRSLDVWLLGVLLALAHLIVTPTVGWLLLTFLGQGFAGSHRIALVVLHAHLGLGGWLFGLVIAVGGRLLPMFLVAPEPKRWQVGVALGLVQTALGAFFVAVYFPSLELVGPGVLAASVVWWAGVMVHVFRRRKKRVVEFPAVGTWAGFACLVVAMIAGLVAAVRPGFDGWNTYGVLALGSAGMMINGLLYQIVPFLLRLAAFKRSKTATTVPPLSRVLATVPYRAQTICFAAGVVLLATSTVSSPQWLTWLGRWTMCAGTTSLALNLARLASGVWIDRLLLGEASSDLRTQ